MQSTPVTSQTRGEPGWLDRWWTLGEVTQKSAKASQVRHLPSWVTLCQMHERGSFWNLPPSSFHYCLLGVAGPVPGQKLLTDTDCT